MTRDPRCALSQELEAKQTLLDLLRALATDDPDFLTDLLEGETKYAHRNAQPRRNQPQAVAPEEIPARWWKPQPPKLDQDGFSKATRARDKALKEAEALTDSEERRRCPPQEGKPAK